MIEREKAKMAETETLVDVELVPPKDPDKKADFARQPYGVVCGTRRGNTYVRKVVKAHR